MKSWSVLARASTAAKSLNNILGHYTDSVFVNNNVYCKPLQDIIVSQCNIRIVWFC